jgi:hypothetical protein
LPFTDGLRWQRLHWSFEGTNVHLRNFVGS